jgi:phospholipase/carboxylesterase
MKYITQKPKITTSTPPPVLIILHGYGADEFDLLPIASQLNPNFLAISIQAPIELDLGGYSWYHLQQTPDGLRGDHQTRIESEELLIKELPAIVASENGNLKNMYLMGFSQGAAMCYALVGRHDLSNIGLNISGVIVLSGYVPDDVRESLLQKDLSNIPFFLSHGKYDDLIPPRAMHNAQGILEHAGAKIFAKEYETGHGLTEETVSDIRNWMKNIIPVGAGL